MDFSHFRQKRIVTVSKLPLEEEDPKHKNLDEYNNRNCRKNGSNRISIYWFLMRFFGLWLVYLAPFFSRLEVTKLNAITRENLYWA